MKYSCAVLFLFLLVGSSIQSTIYVDNVDYNYITTEIPTFIADTSDVVLANAGRFTLQPTSGIAIDTTGPVQLTGSFVSINSGTSITQNAGGSVNLDGADSFSVLTTNLNITADNDFTMTTVANNLQVNVGGSIEALVDQAYLVGNGTVTINSGGGDVQLFSDHQVQVQGENTNILGENRVTLEALYDFSITAVNSFNSRSNLIDFDTLGDIRITSTAGNVKFVGGSQLILEGEIISFAATEGIDVTSLHGDIFINSAQNLFLTSLDTVDYEIVNDANFISQNGPVSFKGDQFSAQAIELIQFDASSLVTDSTNFIVETVVTTIDTQGSIQFNFTGNTIIDSVFNAENSLEITTNYFNSTSDSLLISTSDINTALAGQIIFQSNAIDESTFVLNSQDDTSFTALSQITIFSGTIDNSADDFYFQAFLDININAQYKTFDFINLNSPNITLTGANEIIDGNIGLFESSKDIDFNHSGFLTLNSSLAYGTASFQADNSITFTITDSALFQSIFDSEWSAYQTIVPLQKAFSSSVFQDTNLFSDVTNLIATNEINVDSYMTQFVSRDMSIRSSTGDVSYSSNNFDFWANEAASITADTTASFTFAQALTFRSFDTLSIANLISLSASTSLGFEANEYIQLYANNLAVQASSIDLSTNARSALTWIGATLNSASNNTYFDAPSANYASVDSTTFTAPNIDISTSLQSPIYFTSGGTLTVDMGDGENFANSANDLQITADNLQEQSTAGEVVTSAPVEIYLSAKTFSSQSNSILVNSGANASFTAFDNIRVNDAYGDLSWHIDRDTDIYSEQFNLYDTSSHYKVNDISFTSNAPAYYRDAQIAFSSEGNFNINLTGSFSQNGGSINYEIASSDTLASSDVIDINSIQGSSITVTDGNLTFDGTPANSSIRFQSMDYVVNAASTIDFLAGNLTFSSNATQNIIFESSNNITINTNNQKAFTWTSRDDINTTVGNFTVRANTKDSDGNSISFITTNEQGNFVANVRSGWLNFQSRDSQTYSANFIELYAADDLTFNTSLALSPDTGGITFTTNGFLHNAVIGEKTGITFTSTSDFGYIYFDAPEGKQTFQAGYDLTVNSQEGNIDILANQQLLFTSTQANIIISSADQLSFVTDTGDITFQTSASNTELRASSDISLIAGTNIYLTSTNPITRTNDRAFEFAAASGHINVLANDQSDITWIAGGDFYTQSAETTTQFAGNGIFYTAETGHYIAASKTGIKLLVQNGNMNINASQNINFSSAEYWDTFVYSGQSSYWTAQSKNIQIAAEINTTIRTERNNVEFQAVEGNIFIDSTGQIRIQADGTDANPGGLSVDGVFVNAPNINVYSADQSIIESEAHVTIGANTNPIVKFEAGGSAASTGFEITSIGNIHFVIGEDVNMKSGGNLLMESAKEFDLRSTGSISISTSGTDATGKDFVIRTLSDLNVNGEQVFINGQDAVNLVTFELISFTSTGNNPITSYIDISSSLDFSIDVDGVMDVNAGNWNTVAQDEFDIVVLGDLVFSNYFPSTTGQIYIYGDQSLDFYADTFLNVISSGPNSNITLSTLGANSDILIQTDQSTSSIFFHSLGNFVSESFNTLDFQTIAQLVFSADDNIYNGATGNGISFFTPDNFESTSNTLTLQGDDGVSITTLNRADIQLTSAGSLTIDSGDKMIFDSVNGKLTISATSILEFNTYLGREGDIVISTTRDLLLTSSVETTFTFGGDLSILAQTITFDSFAGILSVISEGNNGLMSFTADIIDITGGQNSQLFGSNVDFSSTGTALLHSNALLAISSIGSHAHIYYSSNFLLSINAPNGINIQSTSAAGEYYGAYDTRYYDYYNHNGQGYVNFTATGANPLFGYGVLVNATNELDVSSNGNIIYNAPLGTVNLRVMEGIAFETGTDVNDKKAIRISAEGTNSKLTFNATQTLNIQSNERSSFVAANAIQFEAYDNLIFEVNSNSLFDSREGIEILSTHPYADIRMNATDFLTGIVTFSGSSGIEVYGERGLDFNLVDDDDSNPVGTYMITSKFISFEAQNSGLIESTSGGDIVISAPTGAVHIHAGDDFYATVTQRFALILNSNWNVETVTPVAFQSPNNGLTQTTTGDTTYNVAGDVFLDATNSISLTANDEVIITSGSFGNDDNPLQSTIITGQAGINVDAVGVYFELTQMRSVDFVDGLIIPTFDGDFFSGDDCNGVGGIFFYAADTYQFCYCADDLGVLLCYGTMLAEFGY